jgi:hypothetical protein
VNSALNVGKVFGQLGGDAARDGRDSSHVTSAIDKALGNQAHTRGDGGVETVQASVPTRPQTKLRLSRVETHVNGCDVGPVHDDRSVDMQQTATMPPRFVGRDGEEQWKSEAEGTLLHSHWNPSQIRVWREIAGHRDHRYVAPISQQAVHQVPQRPFHAADPAQIVGHDRDVVCS